MKAKLRWAVLGGLLTVTLAATAWVRDGDADSVSRKGPKHRSAQNDRKVGPELPAAVVAPDPPASPVTGEISFPERKAGTPAGAEPEASIFAVKSWYVAPPPPPPMPALPPPKPVAPPLPFVFMGRMSDPAGAIVIYLVKGDQSFPVKGGETLEGNYHVDKVAPEQIEFTYLPLHEKQILAIGAPG